MQILIFSFLFFFCSFDIRETFFYYESAVLKFCVHEEGKKENERKNI